MSIHNIVDKIISKKYYILDRDTVLDKYNNETILDYLINNKYYELTKFVIKKPNIEVYKIFIEHKEYSYFDGLVIDGSDLLEEIDGIPLIEWLLNNNINFLIKNHNPNLLKYLFKYNREDLLKGFHISILDIDETNLGYTLRMDPEYIKMEYGIQTFPINSDELLKFFNGYKDKDLSVMDELTILRFEQSFNKGTFSDIDVIELCKRAFKYLLNTNRLEANYFIKTLIMIKDNNPNFHFESLEGNISYFSKAEECITIVPTKLDNYFTLIHEIGHAIHFYSGAFTEVECYRDMKSKIQSDPDILKRVLEFCDKRYKKRFKNNLYYMEHLLSYPELNITETEFYTKLYSDYIISKYGSMEEHDKLILENFDPSEIIEIGLECGYDVNLLKNCFSTKIRKEEFLKEVKNVELLELKYLLEKSTVENQVSVILDSLFDGKIYEGGMELIVDGRKRKISPMAGHSEEYHKIDEARSFKEFMADYIRTKLMPNSKEVFDTLEYILGFDIRDYYDEYYNYLLMKTDGGNYGKQR